MTKQYAVAATKWGIKASVTSVSRINADWASIPNTELASQYKFHLSMFGGSLFLVEPTTNTQEEVVT